MSEHVEGEAASGSHHAEDGGQQRVVHEDRDGEGSAEGHGQDPRGEADRLPDAPGEALTFPPQTPLFHAHHSERYERHRLIDAYQRAFECQLVVLIDVIFPESVTLFEELLVDADPARDLHLLLDSPGGDGETAVRLVRAAQARCRELTVLVPNQAKSAATLLAIGAHSIVMGPTSDLGPVDPQFQLGDRGLYSAKDLIAAVQHAEESIAANPESYPLHVSLLADVTAVMVQQARSALERSADLVREALRSNLDRGEDEVDALAESLKQPLIDLPKDHGAIFGAADARKAGLPIVDADPRSDQWQVIWRLWAKYFELNSWVYEGVRASHVLPRGFPT